MKVHPTIHSVLYIDLELNCPDRVRQGDPEIIEIGIAELDTTSLSIVRERDYLVLPYRDISRLCTKITGLTSDDFKGAQAFKDVIAEIIAE